MAWCLRPELVTKFKQALKSGEIDPFKMAEMSSAQRREFLAPYVGKENAKEVNALFESKLLLKNQVQGYKTWAKKVSGISPKVKQDLLSRIEKMDRVLSPEENEQFLQDLAATRLRINITQSEAENLNKLSDRVKETRKKAKKDGTFENENDRLTYGLAKVNLENFVNELKIQSRTLSFKEAPRQKIIEAITEDVPGAAKSFVSSLDNSFWGRQGIKALYYLPTSKIWVNNFAKSFKNAAKQLTAKDTKWYKAGNDAVMDMIKADIYSRPNAVNGKYKAAGVDIDIFSEEAFPSSFPEKLPVFGRLFKTSEVIFNGGALQMRADLADRLISIAERNGVNTLNKEEAQGIGTLVNSTTGRGSNLLGLTAQQKRRANALIFSIRFFESNIDTLTAHTFDRKATSFTKKQARKQLLGIVSSVGAVMALASLAGFEVEEDPRATNFGRIKIFGNWVDITGGMASIARLAAQTITGVKISGAGNKTDMRAGGFGSTDAFQNIIDNVFTWKLSPIAGFMRDALRNEMFGGEPFNLKDAVANLITPLSIQNLEQLRDNPDSSFILGSVILEGLGLSTSSYIYESHWEKSTSQEMEQFKKEVGKDLFKQANEDYNRAYANWYSKATKSDEFNNLSEEGKDKTIRDAKKQIKEQIFKEYNFKPTKKAKSQEEIERQREEEGVIKDLMPDKIKDEVSEATFNINTVLSKINLIPEAQAGEGQRELISITYENGMIDEQWIIDGKYHREYYSVDRDISLWGETVGKAVDKIGRVLGIKEMGISEALGYEDPAKRIEAVKKRIEEFNQKADEYIQEEVNVEAKGEEIKPKGKVLKVKSGGPGEKAKDLELPVEISNTIKEVFGSKAQEAANVLHHPYQDQVKDMGQGENAGFVISDIDKENYDDNGNLKYTYNPFTDSYEPNIDRGLFRINNDTFYTYLNGKELRPRMKEMGIIDTDDLSKLDWEKEWEKMNELENNVKMAKLINEVQGWCAWFAAPAEYCK